MKIQDLYGVNPPRKPEKQSSVEAARERKTEKKESKSVTSSSSVVRSDQVEISQEAQELHKSDDEQGVARDLLSKLPQARNEVIYEALAKIKAGLYASEEIVGEAASKLLLSGELSDIVKSDAAR